MNREYFQQKGREGGKIGGIATGDRKRRSREHYARIQKLAVEARMKKLAERKKGE